MTAERACCYCKKKTSLRLVKNFYLLANNSLENDSFRLVGDRHLLAVRDAVLAHSAGSRVRTQLTAAHRIVPGNRTAVELP